MKTMCLKRFAHRFVSLSASDSILIAKSSRIDVQLCGRISRCRLLHAQWQ
ncbi:hypothetical protein [Paraburkholderia terrae]